MSPRSRPAPPASNKWRADLGPVDVLVNNAGITRDGMFHRMTPEQWNAVIGTNLGSLFNMTRQVIEGMRNRKFGRIVNISSINGQKGQMGQVNYSAAKAGELGFTKALAQEGARAGITVNAICPGYIATDMVKAMPQDVLQKNILPQISDRPVGRAGGNRPLRGVSRLRRCRAHYRLDLDGERRPVFRVELPLPARVAAGASALNLRPLSGHRGIKHPRGSDPLRRDWTQLRHGAL